MIMSASCWPMKMFDMIVDTTSNNEIKKVFWKWNVIVRVAAGSSFCVVVGTAGWVYYKKMIKESVARLVWWWDIVHELFIILFVLFIINSVGGG